MYLQSIKSVKHNATKSVNRSILKKSRHIGFGVFIVHSSMHWAIFFSPAFLTKILNGLCHEIKKFLKACNFKLILSVHALMFFYNFLFPR